MDEKDSLSYMPKAMSTRGIVQAFDEWYDRISLRCVFSVFFRVFYLNWAESHPRLSREWLKRRYRNTVSGMETHDLLDPFNPIILNLEDWSLLGEIRQE